MVKVFVFYYLFYGYVEMMVQYIVEGVKLVFGVEVMFKCVLEMIFVDQVCVIGVKVDQVVLVVMVDEFVDYDVIIFGMLICFGNMVGQMCMFFDQIGGLWMKGVFVGKIGSVFVLIGMQYGGQEMMIMLFYMMLLYYGMVIVGVLYVCSGFVNMNEIIGGMLYGVIMFVGVDGSCQLSVNEFDIVCYQGKYVVEFVNKFVL